MLHAAHLLLLLPLPAPAAEAPAGLEPPVARASAPAPVDDEAVKDFKKYFRKIKEPAGRVEAVLTLLGNESPKAVDALIPILRDKDPDVARAASRVLAEYESRPPVERMVQKFASEKKEEIRIGLLDAMVRGRYAGLGVPGFDEALAESFEDKSWAVRRMAVLAYAAGGDASRASSLVPFTEDEEIAVRCAALDAMAELKAPETLEPAWVLLEDEAWQVRASAIQALGRVRHKDSIPRLIARFDAEEGRLVEDVGNALDAITGRTLGTRVDQWKRFWERNAARFEIPTDAELAKLAEAAAKNKARYVTPGSTSFGGIDTPSRSILFVIDVSGSMEDLVVQRERFEGGDYPSWSRMDIVKTELARTVEGLESYVKFGIVAFATDTKRWKKKLVPANVINKKSALDFIKKLEPLGGNSKIELQQAGLAGSANLGAGKTNTWGALSLALGIAEKGKNSREEYLSAVDTVFFLSDGRPTHGKYIDTKDILERIVEANRLRKVVLHTIAIGDFSKAFMEQLADRNGGTFVDLGK